MPSMVSDVLPETELGTWHSSNVGVAETTQGYIHLQDDADATVPETERELESAIENAIQATTAAMVPVHPLAVDELIEDPSQPPEELDSDGGPSSASAPVATGIKSAQKRREREEKRREEKNREDFE